MTRKMQFFTVFFARQRRSTLGGFIWLFCAENAVNTTSTLV
jgi:hypothetical protein